MKKRSMIGFAISATLLCTGFAFSGISLHEVNNKVAALLKPINNDKTQVELQFTDLNIDSDKTLDFGGFLYLSKEGSKNKLVVNLNKVEYHYGDGTQPQFDVSGRVDLDLVKIMGQQNINEMAEGIGEMAIELSKEYTEKYGEAVKVDSAVDELLKDEKGDVRSIKMHFDAALDFSKLPPNIPKETVELKNLRLSVSATRKGFSLQARVILNPLHSSFGKDKAGLKEYIEKLLSEDQETYEGLQQIAEMLSSVAGQVVEIEFKE